MPERIIKIDGEIFKIQQRLNEIPPVEEAATLKEQKEKLENRRTEILASLEKQTRDRPE